MHGLAHITGGGLTNLLRLNDGVGFAIDTPLPVPPVFGLIARCGGVDEAEMWDVFNMGCGFVVVVAEADADEVVALLSARHPGCARIGDGHRSCRADRAYGVGADVRRPRATAQ